MPTAKVTNQPEPSVIPTPATFPVSWERPDDARLLWVWDQIHTPGPITPLDEELQRRVSEGLNASFERFSIPLRMRSRCFNTYFYSAIVPTQSPPEEREAQSKRSEAALNEVMLRLLEIWRHEVLPEVKSHLGFWEGFDLRGASRSTLLKHLNETISRYERICELHFLVGTPHHVVVSTFADLFRELLGDEGASDAYTLLSGFDNLTLQASRALWTLSRVAAADSEVRQIIEANGAAAALPKLEAATAGREFVAQLRAYLDEYGRRCGRESIVSDPSWIENPTPVFEMLRDYLRPPVRDPEGARAELAAARERRLRSVRERLAGFPLPVVERFEVLLKAAQEAGVVREDHNYWIDFRTAYEVRRVLLEFGRRFAITGVLERESDIFYLTLDELRVTAAATVPVDRRLLVAGRQAELEYFRGIQPPKCLGSIDAEVPPDSPMMRAAPKLLGVALAPSDDPTMLRGNAGSAGVVRGPARIVRTLGEASKLRRGDVLVAETASPSWTPLFTTAAALVTDAGGVLCHGAVVAREHRLPAVVGTGHATEVIHDGQIVEVDGNNGTVRILAEQD